MGSDEIPTIPVPGRQLSRKVGLDLSYKSGRIVFMPKFSVYVPDDLWTEVQESYPGEKVSEVMQRGLRNLVSSAAATPRVSKFPSDVRERIEAIKARLTDDARADYKLGYEGGLDVADELKLHHFMSLIEENFDVARWLKPYVAGAQGDVIQGFQPAHWLNTAAKTLGYLAAPVDYDDFNFSPTTARLRGFRDALRDVTTAIETLPLQGLEIEPESEQEGGEPVVSDRDEPK
jgi:hypothetical protein